MTEYKIEEVLDGATGVDVVETEQPEVESVEMIEREMVEIPVFELTEEELEAKKEQRKLKMAEGTRNSWQNPETAAARKVRRGCSVLTPEGETIKFDSVCAAFQFFKIGNIGKHIAFRKELRSVEGQTLGVPLDGGRVLEFTDIPAEKSVKAKKVKEPKAKEGDEVGEGYVSPEPKEKKKAKRKSVAVAENVIPETAESVEVEACFD